MGFFSWIGQQVGNAVNAVVSTVSNITSNVVNGVKDIAVSSFKTIGDLAKKMVELNKNIKTSELNQFDKEWVQKCIDPLQISLFTSISSNVPKVFDTPLFAKKMIENEQLYSKMISYICSEGLKTNPFTDEKEFTEQYENNSMNIPDDILFLIGPDVYKKQIDTKKFDEVLQKIRYYFKIKPEYYCNSVEETISIILEQINTFRTYSKEYYPFSSEYSEFPEKILKQYFVEITKQEKVIEYNDYNDTVVKPEYQSGQQQKVQKKAPDVLPVQSLIIDAFEDKIQEQEINGKKGKVHLEIYNTQKQTAMSQKLSKKMLKPNQ